MRFVLITVLSLIVLSSTSANASPRDDAEYLAGLLMKIGLEESMRESVRARGR